MLPRIILTPGEPAGVGPDITLKIAQLSWPAEIVVVADPTLLLARAKLLNIPLQLIDFLEDANPTAHRINTLKIIPVALNTPCQVGKLNPDNASYVLRCLEMATDLCLQKKAHALVTGPVHKSIMNEAQIPFTGHTEFLANRCCRIAPIMLFITEQTKVALATTHLRLLDVSPAITPSALQNILLTLHHELRHVFRIHEPRILVCGLNPHAGENGHLGREEIEVIVPVLKALRAQGLNLLGPLPADTVFTPKYLSEVDVVLGMYHDQVLPVVKYMSFGHAVNVTLGLPIIRTSVDHGTAVDVAGTDKVDCGSLKMAVEWAIRLGHPAII